MPGFEDLGEALRRSTATQPPDYFGFYLAVAGAINSGTDPRGLVKYLAAELAVRRRLMDEFANPAPDDLGRVEQRRLARVVSEFKVLISCADRLPASWRKLLLSEGGLE